LTLCMLDDKAGLSHIAEKHPDEAARRAARNFLREFPDQSTRNARPAGAGGKGEEKGERRRGHH